MSLVEISGLKVDFAQHGGVIEAVRGVGFHVDEGESLGIVGESGSGKSVTCLALMRLLAPTARVSAKTLRLDGIDILSADKRALTQVRGNQLHCVNLLRVDQLNHAESELGRLLR